MICKTCKLEKQPAEFYKSKNTKSGYRGSCIDCINKQNAKWYESNKDALRPVRKKYREENKESISKRDKAWAKANPEKVREANRKSYLLHREEVLKRSKQNHATKPRYASWKNSNRRAKLKENGGTFTYEELTWLFDLYDWKCLNPDCETPDDSITVDHVIPISKGGSNSIENIQPLCLTCNLRKGVQTIDYRK